MPLKKKNPNPPRTIAEAKALLEKKDVYWLVTRVVEERFEVLASNEKEALENASDPYYVAVRKESAVRRP